MIKALPVFLLVLLLAGCGKLVPNYSYIAQNSDATIIFDSEFDLHTFFSVNINPAGNNMCSDYSYVGFILHRDSIFVYDKPNTDLSIRIPTDQLVSVQANHSFNGGTFSSHCGPVGLTFKPEKGKTYLVTMLRRDGIGKKTYCAISIKDAESRVGVNYVNSSKCSLK